MENLVHLIECLKANEVQLIKSFYKAKRGSNKKLQLFKLVQSGKIKTNEQGASKIYNLPPNSAFCHLKKRLEQDILDFLLFSPSTQAEVDAAAEELKCRKLFMQGKILLSRGVYQEGMSLLRKTSQIAEKYEFPDIKLLSDDILTSHSHVKVRSKQYENLISRSLNQLGNIYNAKAINYDLVDNRLKEPGDFEEHKNTENSVFRLKQDCLHRGSKQACYWYHLALLRNSYHKKEFSKAKGYALELLEFLQAEPLIRSKSRLANVYLNLAKILINLKDHSQSIAAANKALPLLSQKTLEQLQALEVSFFAHFRSGKLIEAELICQKAVYHPQLSEFLKRRWSMLHAALKFSQNHFQIVNQTINRHGYHKNDGESRLLGQRLLEMLNILELEDYDWFEFKLESFRKKVAHLKFDTSIRIKMIYQLFKGLLKSNFNYWEAINAEQESFNLLNGNNLDLNWDPMGHELINVRDWIMVKANKQ